MAQRHAHKLFFALLEVFGGGNIVTIPSLLARSVDSIKRCIQKHAKRLGIVENLWSAQRIILCPLHRHAHWTLLIAVITPSDQDHFAIVRFGVFDSLRPRLKMSDVSASSATFAVVSGVLAASDKLHRGHDLSMHVTEKPNGNDCGVFVCLNALELARGCPPDLPPEVSLARQWLWSLLDDRGSYKQIYEKLQRRFPEAVHRAQEAARRAQQETETRKSSDWERHAKIRESIEALEADIKKWKGREDFFMPGALREGRQTPRASASSRPSVVPSPIRRS